MKIGHKVLPHGGNGKLTGGIPIMSLHHKDGVSTDRTEKTVYPVHQLFVRGVSWSEVATVPKRKSHRGLNLNLSLNTEVNIWKGWKENGGTK